MENKQIPNLLDVNEEDLKNLTEMGLIKETSKYGELSQKLLNIFLVAYEQGIKEMTPADVVVIWYKLYGNKLQTAQQVKSRLYSLHNVPYIKYDYKRDIYSPEEDAMDALRYQLSLKSKETNKKDESVKNESIIKELKTLSYEELMNTTFNSLPISTRIKKCLRELRVHTIGELLKNKTTQELMREPNFGPKSLIELESFLNSLGLKF